MKIQPKHIYKLLANCSPNVRRILLMCAVKSLKRPVKIETLRHKEFVDYMSHHCRDYYTELKSSGEELQNEILEVDGAFFKVAKKCHYGSGMLTISFTGLALSLVSNMASVLTVNQMTSIIKVTKHSHVRLLLMLMISFDNGHEGHFDITINNLIDVLELDGVVDEITNFRRNFWNCAAKTLVKHTHVDHLKLTVLERRNRRAYLLRISYQLH